MYIWRIWTLLHFHVLLGYPGMQHMTSQAWGEGGGMACEHRQQLDRGEGGEGGEMWRVFPRL